MEIDARPSRQLLQYAVVCASNQNRSMAAHAVLKDLGVAVSSYGVGTAVRLPGPTGQTPNVYDFGTPYAVILEDLVSKNMQLFESMGLLAMLERNKKIKLAPERWRECTRNRHFDVVYTCENRVFDAVLDDLVRRVPNSARNPCHVINVEIQDNIAGAKAAAALFQRLTVIIEQSDDIDAQMETIVTNFADQNPDYTILYACAYM